jgi:dTDP-4-dehydrorhamnose reductase
MRVLLLGATGTLGYDLARTSPPDIQLTTRSRETLDISSATALEQAISVLVPDCIVNAAAYTNVDQAEREKDVAYRVNAVAVHLLGQLAHQRGIHVVHFSTDHVFGGSRGAPYAEEALCDPVNTYGASKLAGELGLAQSGCASLVVRVQWLFGVGGRSFPKAMLERARKRTATKVVGDQVGRPTYTRDVATAVWELIRGRHTGRLHLANDGSATWHDVAHEIFARVGTPDLLSKCTSPEFPTIARRPRDSRLDTTRAESLLGRRLPPWQNALERFLGECGEVRAVPQR